MERTPGPADATIVAAISHTARLVAIEYNWSLQLVAIASQSTCGRPLHDFSEVDAGARVEGVRRVRHRGTHHLHEVRGK